MFIFEYFCHLYLLGQFGHIIWSSTNWLKFHTGIYYWCLLMSIFSKFLSGNIFWIIFFGLKIGLNWLKFHTGLHPYIPMTILMFIFFFKYLLLTNLCSKCHLRICCSPCLQIISPYLQNLWSQIPYGHQNVSIVSAITVVTSVLILS